MVPRKPASFAANQRNMRDAEATGTAPGLSATTLAEAHQPSSRRPSLTAPPPPGPGPCSLRCGIERQRELGPGGELAAGQRPVAPRVGAQLVDGGIEHAGLHLALVEQERAQRVAQRGVVDHDRHDVTGGAVDLVVAVGDREPFLAAEQLAVAVHEAPAGRRRRPRTAGQPGREQRRPRLVDAVVEAQARPRRSSRRGPGGGPRCRRSSRASAGCAPGRPARRRRSRAAPPSPQESTLFEKKL